MWQMKRNLRKICFKIDSGSSLSIIHGFSCDTWHMTNMPHDFFKILAKMN